MNSQTMSHKIYKLFYWTLLFSHLLTTIIFYGHGFSADTLVQLKDKSLYPIHTIYLATMYTHVPIASYNIITSSNKNQHIRAIKKDRSCYCMHIGFDPDSDDTQNSDIICTITQEFYVPKIGQWIPACNLIIGDELLTSNMTTKPITYIKFVSHSLPIYILEIENSHTLFVGKYSVLAHNIALPAIWVGFSAFCGNGGTVLSGAHSFFGPVSLIVNLSIGLLQFAVTKIINRSSQKEKEISTTITRDCGLSHLPKHEVPEYDPCFNGTKTLTYTCTSEQQSSALVVTPPPCNYSLQHPITNNIDYDCGYTQISAHIDATPLIQSCLTSQEPQKNRYDGPKYHRTEDWIEKFEEQVGKVFERADYVIQGKRAFKVIKNIPGTVLKKGMYVVLDGLHGDHLEVYAKGKQWIFVANFDGTKNEHKTKQGKNNPREPLQRK